MSKYANRTVTLTTMHQKADAIAPAFASILHCKVQVCSTVDTDSLGTFTGEITRTGDMQETAIAKARMGMVTTGSQLGVASEGCFGPHPIVPFIAGARELMVFIDAEQDLLIQESLFTEETNFASIAVYPGDDPRAFLERVGFPVHGVVVRAEGSLEASKGIKSVAAFVESVSRHANLSQSGKVEIIADMRAHQNPTRMRTIATLAEKLARRVASECPACRTPGWGVTAIERGLPCEFCGEPTSLVLATLLGCVKCQHKLRQSPAGAALSAPQGNCPKCNP